MNRKSLKFFISQRLFSEKHISILIHFQYLRITAVVFYIFLQNFALEIVARSAKIDLSEHAWRWTAVLE